MSKIGLKLWSTNKQYVDEAIELFEDKVFDYIELYVVPGSYEKYKTLWSSLKIPYIIHCPHINLDAINFARKDLKEENFRLFSEVQRFADLLCAKYIIFHPGIDGFIEEVIKQVKQIKDNRLIVENMPYYSLIEDKICQGYSFEEINRIKQEIECGFCLDFGHAICSANAQKCDWEESIKNFSRLNPEMFHLTDGDVCGVYDQHLHLGKGTFDLKKIQMSLKVYSLVTIETEKKTLDLSCFESDIEYFRMRKSIKN